MSSDYRLPDGFVNPVPDGHAKRPKPWAGRSAPKSLKGSGEKILKGIGTLIALAFVFSGTILNVVDSQIEDAVDSAKEWAGINQPKADGSVKLEDSTVTASYTPAGGESVTAGEYNGSGFTGSQWILSQGQESITLTDYDFDHSPVDNGDVTDAYYKASAMQMNARAGREVEIDPIRVDGRRGMVWRSDNDSGGWLLLAEFPDDSNTIRLQCATTSSKSVTAGQCEEVLGSLQFGD
ncbi:MAG: hypothetical protein ACRDKE_11225 [Solirubrobacterales bacterium]